MDQNQRRHVHRGRRGQDRRGTDRRTPPPQAQAQAQEQRGRDHVDVEQIMRDIRSRIAQRNGIELSNQQIQELAARRLEAILDPRAIKPALLDELRRGAAAPAQQPPESPEPAYVFEDSTLYESHRGLLRAIRRLLNPLLKLFFNPNPLIRALNTQARLNVEAAQREAARGRQQAEWNALQYELVQRMVTEISRVSLDMQALHGKVESLSAKVDFNERRVRSIEGVAHQPRSSNRPVEAQIAASAPPLPEITSATESLAEASAQPSTPGPVTPGLPGQPGQPGEGARRRRRRRRGRRGAGPGSDLSAVAGGPQAAVDAGRDEGPDDGPDEGGEIEADTQPPMSATYDSPAPQHRPLPKPAQEEAPAAPTVGEPAAEPALEPALEPERSEPGPTE